MRVNRAGWLLGVAVLLTAASASAAGAPTRASRAVQPEHSDLIMARTGIGLWPRTGPRTVASFDYDRDGDLDLFVATQQGMVVWLNDGAGLFSPLPLMWAEPPSKRPAAAWVTTVNDTRTPLDRTERAIARAAPAILLRDEVRAFITPAPVAAPRQQRSAAVSPRAPPTR